MNARTGMNVMEAKQPTPWPASAMDGAHHRLASAALFLWCVLGTRYALDWGWSARALMDDALVCVAGVWLVGVSQRMPRRLRFAVNAVGLVAFSFLWFVCSMFYRFFGSYVNIESHRLLNQLGGATVSLASLVSREALIIHLAVPVGLAFSAALLSLDVRARPAPPLRGVAALLFLGLVHQCLTTRDDVVVSEQNCLVAVCRQVVERTHLALVPPKDERSRVVEGLAELLPVAPPRHSRAHPDFPMLLTPDAGNQVEPPRKLNVVVILLETFRQRETSIGPDSSTQLTPVLSSLAAEGLVFSNFYANGHQTVRGEFSTLCGVLPNIGSGQTYSMAPKLDIDCLPSILQRSGWETHWVSGFSADYGNKRAFLAEHGIDRFHDDPALVTPVKRRIGWGPSDEDIYRSAVHIMDKAKEPFFVEVMSLSNHHPFKGDFGIVPSREIQASKEQGTFLGYLRGLQYSDYALGTFMAAARTRPWFSRTVFVILGDHGTWLFPEKADPPLTSVQRVEAMYRVPLLMMGPGLKPGVSPVIGSQIDVAPTLMDVLGIVSENTFEGASLMRQDIPPEERIAILGNESGWSIRRGNDYCYAVGQECFLTTFPYCPEGHSPKSASHACFRATADVLGASFGESKSHGSSASSLSSEDAAALLRIGRRRIQASNLMTERNAFRPNPAGGAHE